MVKAPLDTKIHFLISVPDWQPDQATPLQGFALSLCRNAPLIRILNRFPSDIREMTEAGRNAGLAGRLCGGRVVNWHPQSPRAILSMPTPEPSVFVFVIVGNGQNPAEFMEWALKCPVRPTIVADKDADITISQLTLATLKQRLLAACDAALHIDGDEIASARQAINDWIEPPVRRLAYQVQGHATVGSNVEALGALGIADLISGPFDRIREDVKPYIEQIVSTSESLLAERSNVDIGGLPYGFAFSPVLNLFAPAMQATIAHLKPADELSREEKRRFESAKQLLENQRGYNLLVRNERQKKVFTPIGDEGFEPHPLFQIRQYELALSTEVMATLAASDLSVTLRMPNDVNRTAGAARQFAAHYRSDENRLRKRLLAFREMQNRLHAAVPPEFIDILKKADGDIRIVADAHLEWLKVDGLPLCIRKQVSRIPVTPGNLFVSTITDAPPIRLFPTAFASVLVISALDRADPIRGLFEVAFEMFGKQWKDSVNVKFVEVSNADELISALNAFDGALMMFDGHGSHAQDEPAVLHLKDDKIDVWELNGKVRVPPIIILSACDTHAADRNHATTAIGFLSLGARCVLGSVFPLAARHAAVFAARLLYRVAAFVPAAVGMRGRPILWTEVVSGMMRMQLLTDFLRLLERKHIINEATYVEVHQMGNHAINDAPNDEAFEDVIAELVKRGLDEAHMWRELEIACATSAVISYLNIGRPETITLDTPERIARFEQYAEEAAKAAEKDMAKSDTGHATTPAVAE